MLNREIIMSGSEGCRVDILKLNIDKLEVMDKRSVAKSAGFNLLDRRVANNYIEDGQGTKGVLAYDPHRDVVHANFRDSRRKDRLR